MDFILPPKPKENDFQKLLQLPKHGGHLGPSKTVFRIAPDKSPEHFEQLRDSTESQP